MVRVRFYLFAPRIVIPTIGDIARQLAVYFFFWGGVDDIINCSTSVCHVYGFLPTRLCENSNAFRTEHLGESHIDAYYGISTIFSNRITIFSNRQFCGFAISRFFQTSITIIANHLITS